MRERANHVERELSMREREPTQARLERVVSMRESSKHKRDLSTRERSA